MHIHCCVFRYSYRGNNLYYQGVLIMTFFVVTLSVLVIYLLILVMVQKKIISMLRKDVKKLSTIDLDKEVDEIIEKMNKDISVEIGDVNVKDSTSQFQSKDRL